MFTVFTLNIMAARQTKHDNDNLQRALQTGAKLMSMETGL